MTCCIAHLVETYPSFIADSLTFRVVALAKYGISVALMEKKGGTDCDCLNPSWAASFTAFDQMFIML